MEKKSSIIKVALVDDHSLLRNALANLVDSFGECKVINQLANGKDLVESIKLGVIPDVIILDLNMPEMDGFETAEWLSKNCPQVHVLMLTMYDSELSLIRLLQLGVKGFLKKDIHPSELKYAIQSVATTGFYYSTHTTGRIVNLFRNSNGSNLHGAVLTEQEMKFLKFACSDLTYKEIAQKMGLNPRSIDTLRDHLFVKLDVRSRVGLAMIAIRHGLVSF
jgi:DNA-binding NarL/FixJ family response regulator